MREVVWKAATRRPLAATDCLAATCLRRAEERATEAIVSGNYGGDDGCWVVMWSKRGGDGGQPIGLSRTGGRSSQEISSHGSFGWSRTGSWPWIARSAGSDGTDGLRSGTDWCRAASPDVAYPSAILGQSQHRRCQRQRVPVVARRGKSHCSRRGRSLEMGTYRILLQPVGYTCNPRALSPRQTRPGSNRGGPSSPPPFQTLFRSRRC